MKPRRPAKDICIERRFGCRKTEATESQPVRSSHHRIQSRRTTAALRPRTTRKPRFRAADVDLEPDALQALSSIPQFPVHDARNFPSMCITYQTSEPVDDLMTYVFQVTPKQVDREHAYFSGLIWVDDHDLAIVKTYGKWVSELGDMKPPNLPFTMYETYRQPVANKYWMPAYARSDGVVKIKDGNMPVRLIIRWDNYKPAPKPPAHPLRRPAGRTNREI